MDQTNRHAPAFRGGPQRYNLWDKVRYPNTAGIEYFVIVGYKNVRGVVGYYIDTPENVLQQDPDFWDHSVHESKLKPYEGD